MWNDISPIWRAAFAEGWEAFKNGSIPIGAAIADESGKIVCVGRNRRAEPTELNRRLLHAETDCLLRTGTAEKASLRSLTLYACMEPCPMCMGTFVMSGLRWLRVAARDGYCGAVHYKELSYIRSKNIDAAFEGGDLEVVQLTMQAYYEIKNGKENGPVVESFAADCPSALAVARELYADKTLDRLADSGAEFQEVFDLICSRSV